MNQTDHHYAGTYPDWLPIIRTNRVGVIQPDYKGSLIDPSSHPFVLAQTMNMNRADH